MNADSGSLNVKIEQKSSLKMCALGSGGAKFIQLEIWLSHVGRNLGGQVSRC
jgi:hypothetical protein